MGMHLVGIEWRVPLPGTDDGTGCGCRDAPQRTTDDARGSRGGTRDNGHGTDKLWQTTTAN